MKKQSLILLASAGLLVACSPKIYVIDRQTVLEDEAAGDWPQFDKSAVESSASAAPTPLDKTEDSQRKQKIFRVLNGAVAGAADSDKAQVK